MACNICNWHMSSKFSSEVLETFAGSVVTKRTENEKGNHCKNILSGSLNDSLKFNLEECEKFQNMNNSLFSSL